MRMCSTIHVRDMVYKTSTFTHTHIPALYVLRSIRAAIEAITCHTWPLYE